MALTGIQIFKFLPAAQKTENANCKKCGSPTCMAFSMKLAKGDKKISDCPYAPQKLKEVFLKENKIPQVKIDIKSKTKSIIIGGENVMFRHDKTFCNPTCLSIQLSSEDENFEKKFKEIKNYSISRVGSDYGVDCITLVDNGENFINKAKFLFENDIPIILVTDNFEKIHELMLYFDENKPLVYLITQNVEDIITVSQKTSVVVDGKSIEELTKKTESLLKQDIHNIVLNYIVQDINANVIEPLTAIRRSAVENKFEPLGFPVMLSYDLTNNMALDSIRLSSLVCKYVNLISLNGLNTALLTALITLRMNLYTDPQKPLQVEPKLYEIGATTENSPVIVTTNFALTYFAVVNELESLQNGTFLIITNSDGMSVLTAWAASKFTPEIIAKSIENSKIRQKVTHKNIVIPGLVSDLKEELEELLPEYNIIVGTNEASDLPLFLTKL